LGAAQAGVEVRIAVENDPHAAATYAANHPRTTLLRQDIRRLKDIPIRSNGSSTVLFGGPPCQGFSTSNQRTRSSRNPQNWLVLEFLRIARLWRPKWVVFENVKGFVETADGIFLRQLQKSLADMDYSVTTWVLNAAEFGVPQVRSRLFVVGSAQGAPIPKPEGTRKAPLTVADAIADLPQLENGASIDWLPYEDRSPTRYARRLRGKLKGCKGHLVSRNARYVVERYKHIPQGGNWEDIPNRLMRNYADPANCHTGIYHRLDAKKPSIVLGNYRKNMVIHPTESRGLSVREAARLQSFPDWYDFKGSIGFQQQQVGNAVPPLLAEVVFQAVVKLARE